MKINYRHILLSLVVMAATTTFVNAAEMTDEGNHLYARPPQQPQQNVNPSQIPVDPQTMVGDDGGSLKILPPGSQPEQPQPQPQQPAPQQENTTTDSTGAMSP